MANELYRIECDPACEFMVQSHDQDEVVMIAKDHLKNKHHMDTTEEEIRSRMVAA